VVDTARVLSSRTLLGCCCCCSVKLSNLQLCAVPDANTAVPLARHNPQAAVPKVLTLSDAIIAQRLAALAQLAPGELTAAELLNSAPVLLTHDAAKLSAQLCALQRAFPEHCAVQLVRAAPMLLAVSMATTAAKAAVWQRVVGAQEQWCTLLREQPQVLCWGLGRAARVVHIQQLQQRAASSSSSSRSDSDSGSDADSSADTHSSSSSTSSSSVTSSSLGGSAAAAATATAVPMHMPLQQQQQQQQLTAEQIHDVVQCSCADFLQGQWGAGYPAYIAAVQQSLTAAIESTTTLPTLPQPRQQQQRDAALHSAADNDIAADVHAREQAVGALLKAAVQQLGAATAVELLASPS
jgi:hypothetical protein